MGEKLLIDPHSPAYEAARAEMVEVLRQIGREDSRNGYAQMAHDLAAGNLTEVPTWIALALMAARAPADLRSALEAETCSICGGKSFVAVDVRQFDGIYAPGPERRCVECKTTFTAQAFAALAPTKGDAS